MVRWSGIKYLDLRWDCSAMDSLVAVSETVATFDHIDGEQDSGTVALCYRTYSPFTWLLCWSWNDQENDSRECMELTSV
jgi:hypothetical protein